MFRFADLLNPSHSGAILPPPQSLPFPSGPTRKVPVAIGLGTFLVFGFSLPFIAAKFQIAKASW